MNLYILLITFITVTLTSYGYNVGNCNGKSNTGTCIYMTFAEDAFQKKFLPLLDGMTAIQIDFAAYEYNNKTDDVLRILNEIIADEVNQTTMKEFTKQLPDVTYKNPTNVTLVGTLPDITDQSRGFLMTLLINFKVFAIENNQKNDTDKSIINDTLPIPMIKKTFQSEKKIEYQGSSKFKIGICLIGKNFSSIMIRIFCILNKNKKIKHCTENNRYSSIDAMARQYKLKGIDEFFEKYKMLMIVRNPIDRLISGFMQLCYYRIYLKPNDDYCYGCDKNLTCFIDNLQADLWNVVKNQKIPDQFYDYHFYPQTWQCEYYKYKYMYKYIKYSLPDMKTFYDTIIIHLGSVHVPKQHLNYLRKILQSTKTPHITSTRNATIDYKNILYNNSTLLKRVCLIFYYDFIEFGFKFPKNCLDRNIKTL
ncbi:Sulfotransferase family-containing protein [Strongyloides ratti]|uniref:Sulfotransferase family-containing protein n=1 Tax=Strongyloides ratti TaxID=34506 RepID=A0A090L0C0_STRRB|nr:Sulfotransferase family-containing protein [Strongyloides ratti]CEF60949.1 Sulfotransferase family-containing protein [Strongyloides ratti]